MLVAKRTSFNTVVAMNKKLGWFLLTVFILLTNSAFAQERRVALVVGIANYQAVPKLKNTINDSELIAKTLEELNFEVTRLVDAGLVEMRTTIDRFAFVAETADIALVYYAGHGMEVGGENLLIPSDTSASNRKEVASQSVSLDEILHAVDKARQLRIVILDSCRNDPFATPDSDEVVVLNVASDRGNSVTGGLAPPAPDRGTLVAFAAEAGKVASDGDGTNSPFALALSKNLKTADLEIGLMFRRVRDRVLDITGNTQEPHTYGSLSGNPYFLAGRSQQVNTLGKLDRRNAWAVLKPDQEVQLAALAEDGDTRAIKGLAYMRLDPNEERYNPLESLQLLTRAANSGDPEAQFELARLYERGIGTEQDVEKSLELYWKSADNQFPDAINDLGFLHFQGGLGITRDPKKAIRLFERAANLRHPEAMFNLAALIDDGIVPGKTSEDAALYLYDSLRSGNEDVLTQLSENPKMFKSNTRVALQKLLTEREFYEGAADGRFGPQTKRGLRKAYGLEE